MAAFEIVFEALDQASPAIQRLSEQFMDMAAKSDKFAGVIESSTRQADEGLTKVPPKAQAMAESLNAVQTAGQQLLQQVLGFASVAGLVAFFKESADAAIQEEAALRRVAFAVDSTGGSFSKQKDSILEFAKNQQDLTQFSENQTLDAFGKLVRVTGDVGQAMQATRLTFGLAAASGKDVNSVLDLLGPVLNGDSTRLRALRTEFGAFVGNAQSAQQVVDALSKTFTGVAEKGDGTDKQITILHHTLEDFAKTVGQGVLPVYQLLLEGLAKGAESFEGLGLVIANFGAQAFANLQGLGEKIIAVMKGQFDRLPEISQETAAKLQAIEQASGEQALAIQKKYSKDQVDTVSGQVSQTTALHVRETDDRKKQEQEAQDFIKRLQADELDAEHKKLDAKLKMIEIEKDQKLQQLEELHQKGLLTDQDLLNSQNLVSQMAITRSREAQAEFSVLAKTAKDVSDSMARSVATATADMILQGKSFEDAMKSVFDAVLRTAIETFTRVAIEAAIAKEAAMAITDGADDGSGGGWFADLPKAFKFASGGVVTKPTLGIVGEAGPEAVIPLSQAPALGQTQTTQVTVNQTNHITLQGSDDDQVKQMMRKMADLTRNGAAEGAELVKSILSRQGRVAGESV